VAIVCKKCGHLRTQRDTGPRYACPACGAVYAKVAALGRRQFEREQRQQEKPAGQQERRDVVQVLPQLQDTWVCPACRHVGKPKTVTRGSFPVELVLWLAFLIPGIIYSLWRLGSRYKACSMCGAPGLIPAASPVGRKLIEHT